jgi:cytochrome b561
VRFRNTPSHYGLISKLLHWTIAVLILGLVWLGAYMVELSYFDKWYNQSLSLHKSLGLLVFALAGFYFTWKIFSPSPIGLAVAPRWQQISARLVHAGLMLLMVAIPLSGYLISTSAGKPVDFFGLFEVPPPARNNKEIRDLAITLHYYCAYGIVLLVVAHAGAAVKHQLFDKDGTLARMLWR